MNNTEESVLEIVVVDEVGVSDAAPGAVKYPVPSPYFQPGISVRVERESHFADGSPRGPTVLLDMDIFGADL